MPGTPTPRRKRLGSHLREVRERAAGTTEEISELLRIDPSTVSRYETGHVRPPWPSMQAMLGHYQATAEDRSKATELWEDAGQRAIRLTVPTGSSKAFRSLLRAESEAATMRVLSTVAIHGQLQTREYARAIHASGHRLWEHVTQVEHFVTARLKRQKRLTGPNPLHLHVVLDEVVIRRTVGGPEVMAEQLAHLLKVGQEDNVTLQVIPFSAGVYGTMSGGCTIIGYGEDEDYQPAVYVEHTVGGEWVEDRADVQRFELMFGDVAETALEPDDSAELIRSAMKALGEP
jgi:transcriptional regulator with XRE-family HTH domain